MTDRHELKPEDYWNPPVLESVTMNFVFKARVASVEDKYARIELTPDQAIEIIPNACEKAKNGQT